MVVNRKRGFAAMDRDKQREIARKGGKAAHQKGTAHKWSGEEARAAGRKGGVASHHPDRKPNEKPSPTEADQNSSPS
jgi:general stress protein YciG